MSLTGRNLIDLDDLSDAEIAFLLDEARQVQADLDAGRAVKASFARPPIMLSLFHEPSTRTRLSFESAMAHLGGQILSVEMGATTSSATKGETLEDTGRVVSAYADVIVMRHPQRGAVRRLAKAARIPVINGGDGSGAHPTQALLDLFTVRAELGRYEGLRIAVVGDLKYGRAAHSFIAIMARYGARFVLVAPHELKLGADAWPEGADIVEADDVTPFVPDLDIIYMTRIQRERFANTNDFQRVQGSYQITGETLANAPTHLRVMHPLPRVDEIAPEVDTSPHAAYFRQSANGVPMRIAIFRAVLGAGA